MDMDKRSKTFLNTNHMIARTLCVTFILLLLSAGAASAAIITVNASGGADFMSIQAAIDDENTVNGDTIEVYSGTYFENVNVTKQLILRGVDIGGGKPVVDAGGSGNAITLSIGQSRLEGFVTINSGPIPGAGIMITSDNNVLKDNDVSSNYFGIHMDYSNDNTIVNNNLHHNSKAGIRLDDSNYNNITDNTVSYNTRPGIRLEASSHNTITNNIANNNGRHGINIESLSNYNNIIGNYVSINGLTGIRITNLSIGNVLHHNNILNNNIVGIDVENPTDTQDNVYDNTSSNQWDNGIDIGNHYDNFDEPGEGCTDNNGDGICDSIYTITGGGSVDRYPLVEINVHTPIGEDVLTWGSNDYGQLGDGTTTDRSTPAQVLDPSDPTGNLTDIISTSAGHRHTLALKNDGTVWAWGRNTMGQLGDGTTTSRSTPVQVLDPSDPTGNLTDIISTLAGYVHTLALKNDGTVWAWGLNDYGQLGDGTTTNRLTPVQVLDPSDPTGNLSDILSISAFDYRHTVALKNDGTVWAWGSNNYGQLGDGTTTNRSTPVQVLDPSDPTGNLTDVISISSGRWYTVALKNDGTVWAWGYNLNGQLGDGTTTDGLTPVQVVDPSNPTGNLTDILSISAQAYHTLALKNDGTVWAWGLNDYGQLGDGTTTDGLTPVQVVDPSDPTGNLTDIISISAGHFYTLALKNDGTVWAWGRNTMGQLGDGTTTDKLTPVQVNDLVDVTYIDAGGFHNIVLKSLFGIGAPTVITVDDSGGADYTTIQAAVDNASAGDTILVRDGTYTENIDINKKLTVKSENGSENTIVQAANPNDHVFYVSVNNVNITGFNVTGATGSGLAGVYLNYSDYSKVSNVNASNNEYGIYVYGANYNNISNNDVMNNRFGISCRFSNNNFINNNNIYDNDNGIHFVSSNNNSVDKNTIQNNVNGIYIRKSTNNTVVNNTIKSNSGYGLSTNSLFPTAIEYTITSGDEFNFNMSITNSTTNGSRGNILFYNDTGGVQFMTWGTYRSTASHYYIAIVPTYLLKYPITLEDNWTTSIISNGYYPVVSTVTVQNVDDTVYIPIGTFTNVVKTRQELEYPNGYSNYEYIIAIERWYAPNVGIIKIITYLNTGESYTGSLNEYSITSPVDSNYFPLSIGNRWIYEWIANPPEPINIIYNNYFNNTNNTLLIEKNYWNDSKTLGANIIDGPYLGGNYWAHPDGTGFSQTCADDNGDGICDSAYVLDANNTDYLPLAYDTIPVTPTIGSVHNINTGINYTTIQSAIDSANPGDEIHVDSGPYPENVNVNKQLTLRGIDTGAGMPVVDAGGSGSAITLAVDGITLDGFTATGSGNYPETGIKVISNNNTLNGNTVSNNSNSGSGILLESSSNNTLSGNTVSNNSYIGIWLYSSSNNNTLSGNTVSTNSYSGILLESSSNNNTLIGNTASTNYYGILLSSSSNNTLIGNTATNNTYQGIYLVFSSNNNTISGNNASLNNVMGIMFSDSNNNSLSSNNINSNNRSGIYIRSSSNNTLSGNNVNSNFRYGIFINKISNYNTLSGNNVNSNYDAGIRLSSSNNNIIYNNYFNNTNNSNDTGINNWNITRTFGTNIIGGPFIGGNFWANPSGTGFSQSCVDSERDGICDSSFPIDFNNSDLLPLAAPDVPSVPSEIHGKIFNDTNGNGIIDGGESGVSDVDIRLTRMILPGIEFLAGITSTDLNGNYSYKNISSGYYRIEEFPVGSLQTFPVGGMPHFVTLGIGEIKTGLDFGNLELSPGEISGIVFNDSNGNGVQDVGEPGMLGISICISPSSRCTTTDNDGNYDFTDVPPGTYTVYEYLSSGYLATTPTMVTETLNSGEVKTVNFGNRLPIPPPEDVSVVQQYGTQNGVPTVLRPGLTVLTIHKNLTGILENVVAVNLTLNWSDGTTKTANMAEIDSTNVWVADISPPFPSGTAQMRFEVDVFPAGPGSEDAIQIGDIMFIDPSGTISDACTGSPINGANATLFFEYPPGTGNFIESPSENQIPSDNPLITGEDGRYSWLTVPGTYKVRAEKEGYTPAESNPVSVPEPVTNLNISLTPITGCSPTLKVLASGQLYYGPESNKWTSHFRVGNYGTQNTNADITFYDPSGTQVNSTTTSIPRNASANYEWKDYAPGVSDGTALINSPEPVSVLTFQRMATDGKLGFWEGIPLNTESTEVFVSGLLYYPGGGWRTGVKVLNEEDTPATVTMYFYNSAGTQINSITRTIQPKVSPYFDWYTYGYNVAGGSADGTMKAVSDRKIHVTASQAIETDGKVGFWEGIPLTTDNTQVFVSGLLYYPGGGWRSGFKVANYNDAAASFTINFYNSGGGLANTVTRTIAPRSSPYFDWYTYGYNVPGGSPDGTAVVVSNKPVRIVASQAIETIGIVDFFQAPEMSGDNTAYVVYQVSDGVERSGIKVANPGTSAISADITFYDQNGGYVNSITETIGAKTSPYYAWATYAPGVASGSVVVEATGRIVVVASIAGEQPGKLGIFRGVDV